MFVKRSSCFLFRNSNILRDNLVSANFSPIQSTNCFISITSKVNMSSEAPENPQSVYDFKVKDTFGNDVSLDKYKGKVLLVVNIASQCGLTNTNYKELTELAEKYKDQDVKILSFPCNQFANEMPEKDGEEMVCHLKKANANVGDVFKKVDVNGAKAAPLYKFLKDKQGGFFGDGIKWNFTKFLVDKDGKPVERFAPTTSPKNIASKIDELLQKLFFHSTLQYRIDSSILSFIHNKSKQCPVFAFSHTMFLKCSSCFLLRNSNLLRENLVPTNFSPIQLSNRFISTTSKVNMSSEAPENPQSVHDFKVKDTFGNDVSLDKYKGKVLLIVNIASQCGLANTNYKELTELSEKYKDQDVKILSFPCNQFANEMPEKDGEEMVCHLQKANAKVGDVFKKVDVNGEKAAPLYKFLKDKQGFLGDGIKWNFTKFLVDKDGKPVERYAPTTSPKNIASKIDELLQK
ncbi:uncharacterized protein LOC129577706 [Sitodiplosis mosellana]|uniref:uncharacterized protein LOC129577706 n=1 Tax=Sitodiplosis mosellana TaxID=263140 RepID=UPI002443F304|nr:uncharacterized protein LOC129577706 [Sitodiplosis mosellana]